MIPERLLHGVQLAVLGQTFDGGDTASISLHSKNGARLDTHAIQMHGAGAALARITADVGACQPENISKEMHEQHAGFNISPMLNPINGN
jgi:hypothetical protein